MRIVLAVAVAFFLALPAIALDPRRRPTEYRLTTWTSKDGLPAMFIYSVAQSSDGYLWLGSTDGLARFDGVQFVHWRSNGNRILLGAVRVVRAARDRGLWVGTASGIVGRIRGDDLTSATIEAPVEALLEARDGTLWAATTKRIVRFHPESLAQTGPPIDLPADFKSGLLQDSQGLIWLSTSRGIEQIDPASGELRSEKHIGGTAWLSQDHSGVIWITKPEGRTLTLQEQRVHGTSRGTSRESGSHRSGLDIRAVVRDNQGSTWIGTIGKGLFRVRSEAGDAPPEGLSRADGLSNDNVSALFEDREHNLWIGTQYGLSCLRDGAITTLNRRGDLGSDNVDALAAGPDGKVWASTRNGINRMDSAHVEQVSGAPARALFTDRESQLWAANSSGVARVANGIWSRVQFPSGLSLKSVAVMADDDRQRLWIFDTDKGLYRWYGEQIDGFSNEPLLRGKSIRAIRADRNGRVWFGLSKGGVVVLEGGIFRAYSGRDGLAGGSINAVSVDEKGIVWIGAEHGLSRFDGERFVTWNSAQGLPAERVLWILPAHDDGLWLGYTNGLARVSRAELDRALHDPSHPVAREFFDNDGDGLKGDLIADWQSPAVQASDGTIWFTTSGGVAFIEPEHLRKNPLPPPVHIERMIAETTLVETGSPVHLRPHTRYVQFDYTALSLVAPRHVRFRYKLEGYDSDWQEAGTRRQAFYTNLDPGPYHFHVRACNNDGLWNDAGATLDFEVLPAFYQTRWFLVACVLVSMIVAWGVYRMRVWQLTAQLRERFEERLGERTRIAQELHDNLLQNLLGVSLQIEVTDELLPPDLPAKQPLQKALRLSKSALNEGRSALNDLRALSLSADDIVKGFSQTADGLRKEGAGEMSILVEGRERRLNPVTGNDVLQIGRQAIANAFQHAQAEKIRVLLSYGKGELRISVQDNGCGVDEDTITSGRPGHHGIRGMRERAERIGGTLSIRSGKGQGTEVDLSVPADLVYQNAEGDA